MRFGIHALQMSSIIQNGPWQGTKQIIGYGQDYQALGKGDLEVIRELRPQPFL